MDIKKITDKEKQILYMVAEQYQEKGTITNACPRCGGKLRYTGNDISYRITCENECGIVFSVRGI